MNEINQKQIEEMAKDLKNCLPSDWFWLKTVDTDANLVAKHFYDLGYRQVKDKVVLSKEEYESIQKLLTYDKPMLGRIDSFIKDIKEQARKETAKEILAKLQGIGKLHTEFDWNDYLKIDVDDFYKLAKQYGVDLGE